MDMYLCKGAPRAHMQQSETSREIIKRRMNRSRRAPLSRASSHGRVPFYESAPEKRNQFSKLAADERSSPGTRSSILWTGLDQGRGKTFYPPRISLAVRLDQFKATFWKAISETGDEKSITCARDDEFNVEWFKCQLITFF